MPARRRGRTSPLYWGLCRYPDQLHVQDCPLPQPSLPVHHLPGLVQMIRVDRVKHFSPPSLSGCDYLKHGAPSARGHVVKGHVARPARNPPRGIA